MNRQCTIGQLARDVGVPVSTVRYYERRRLLRADDRSSGNYRLFGESSLERLKFIRAAQEAGFTLADIRALLHFRDGEREPCGKVQALIEDRLRHIATELRRLRQAKALLTRWHASCRATRRPGRCGVLDLLGEPSQKDRKARKST